MVGWLFPRHVAAVSPAPPVLASRRTPASWGSATHILSSISSMGPVHVRTMCCPSGFTTTYAGGGRGTTHVLHDQTPADRVQQTTHHALLHWPYTSSSRQPEATRPNTNPDVRVEMIVRDRWNHLQTLHGGQSNNPCIVSSSLPLPIAIGASS